MNDFYELKNSAADESNSWPWDQSYANHCRCGARFTGPKRAPMCWKCASSETRDWWMSKFQPIGSWGLGETSENKITASEMKNMFGDVMPIEAVNLLFNAPDGWTIGKVRAKLRRIAKERRKIKREGEG